jgi:flagellar L-ring protein precursor FlgH
MSAARMPVGALGRLGLALAGLALLVSPALAAPKKGAAADTAGAAAAARANAAMMRANWLSDRLPLRVGDLLTVVVDEQTAARERVSNVATGDRSVHGQLRAVIKDKDTPVDINSSLNADSRDVGEANREGNLTAVLTVRVVGLEPSGAARVEGSKQVNVDGRLQDIGLKGLVRPEDVSTSNLVNSSRIAEAVITYKGKKIGPRMGIVGKFLAMLWP